MFRLVLTLALAVALAVVACAPAPESRVVIASAASGPRVIFEDELRAPLNWPAAQGTICKSSYADGGFVVENIGTAAPCLLGPVRAESYPASVRIEVSARQRKGTREGAFGLMFASRGSTATDRTFATFALTANGTYRMASWSGGKWVYPVPPTATRSVKTEYGALNTLAVELRDRSVVAYVNGRPVATAELGAEASGTLGLYVDQRGMEVVFSHLRVIELAPMR